MARVTPINLYESAEQPVLYIRKTAAIQDVPLLTFECFGLLTAHLELLGETLADIPYVSYRHFGSKAFEVEFGFPVASPLKERDPIKSGFIPAGIYIFCFYRGPYSQMESVYREMEQWIEDNGYQSKNIIYEQYCNGPEYPSRDMLTKIIMAIE